MSDLSAFSSDCVFLGDEVFYAPTPSDLFDHLLGEHRQRAARIEFVSQFMEKPETQDVLHYFLQGNASDSRGSRSLDLSAKQLFQTAGAVAALNAAYWSKALALTDVLEMMPQARRSEWHEIIRTQKTPPFEEATVRSTIGDLIAKRPLYLAERVDGIFRGLSGEHVTNCPEAFGKRMIMGGVLSEWGSVSNYKAGLLNDLRCVIAKFMGRDEPKYWLSTRLLESMKKNWGQWVLVDGGALSVRLYKKGTIHVEVHPDMAWRLNQILAYLHPLAIPSQFRSKRTKAPKEVMRILRPLPFSVIAALEETKQVSGQPRSLKLPSEYQFSKHVLAEAQRVLESIGGVKNSGGWFDFDYSPDGVVDEIVASGCMPDQKTHQFYPTPPNLAAKAIELAQIGQGDVCLEPSAGVGSLADLLPKERTRCVEVSALHCAVLSAKGFATEKADFLKWSGGLFDRIVMNPPFDQGQWAAHLNHAATMLKEGGLLVAVLPLGAKSKTQLPGCNLVWHGPFENEFADTTVSVVILVATRCKAD